MKRRADTGSEVLLPNSILDPNTFPYPKNVRDPKKSPLFQIITMEVIKNFAQRTYIQVQDITLYILKMGIRNGVASFFKMN